ncbi:MAG: phosphatase domain-containing protein [Dokdonella sp.]
MTTHEPWPAHVGHYLRTLAIDVDDHIDTARKRLHIKFGFDRPRHIAAYRAWTDGKTVELTGRVLGRPPAVGGNVGDHWWDNLLNTYRRFNASDVPGLPLVARFRNASALTTTNDEGYYQVTLPVEGNASDNAWENASIALEDGSLLTPQPVLQIDPAARIGVISDIDDTVLQSSITDWKTAAQLAFLHNARTRKPLLGVAKLYQALQAGTGGARNPIFYVTNSPWNLYDLVDDFLDLNAIPFGPMSMRKLGLHDGETFGGGPTDHKLHRVTELVDRFPGLKWVLLGDSGQMDAATYSAIVHAFPDRIAAIYIRDVDPSSDTVRDKGVDALIEKVSGTKVPMLRVADSVAIAEHALQLGLIDASALAGIAADVKRDAQRPTLTEATVQKVGGKVADAIGASPPSPPGDPGS